MNKPEEVLKARMQAVNNGDLEGLTALYDESAVLIPTFSNRLLGTSAMIREYFVRLAGREELSIALHEKTLKIQTISQDVYVMSGIYCWRFAVDGELLSFEARFSYVIDFSKPRPIIHHHSSQIPRTL